MRLEPKVTAAHLFSEPPGAEARPPHSVPVGPRLEVGSYPPDTKLSLKIYHLQQLSRVDTDVHLRKDERYVSAAEGDLNKQHR